MNSIKQVMMIVLTEVGEGDQHMIYANGSHRLCHPYDKYVNARISRGEFMEKYSRFEVLYTGRVPEGIQRDAARTAEVDSPTGPASAASCPAGEFLGRSTPAR